MADIARARRLAERIRVLAAEGLERVVKEPDLALVTFTDARVSPDLSQCRLFYTVLGSLAEQQRTIEILEQYRGRLRKEIGSQLGIRITPTIELVRDELPETAGQLSNLLAEAKRRDAELQEIQREAKPAGEPNPYRIEPERSEAD
jgi:ribosome-binding factor A